MLTAARPLFENVPADFADPLGLVDQQAPEVVSLVVARYDADGATSGPVIDAFVAVGGQLLAVARSTPDYRYPVLPSVALDRFLTRRDSGHPAVLSLYEVDQEACARFVESTFFSECLKLHVDGSDSADLVARQIGRSGCRNGVLEINDFTDPACPRVRLLDLGTLIRGRRPDAPAAVGADGPPPRDRAALADALANELDGVCGRVLLYDRAKNLAALPDRTGRPWDLAASVAEADRLARARGTATPEVQPASPVPAGPPDAVERVEEYLRERSARPRLVESTHPVASGLAGLVAELQGRPARPRPAPDAAAHAAEAPGPTAAPAAPADPAGTTDGQPPPPPATDGPASEAAAPAPRHPLATDLDRLRSDVYGLFEDAVGRDRAAAHEAHVLAAHAIPSPVPPRQTLPYLRALLTDAPPRRWHFFKASRARTYEVVCAKLLAFHGAHAHHDDPVIHEVNRLWVRLHK